MRVKPRRRSIPASWIAIAAMFALVALPRPAIPLIDGDVYWHIRAGLEVLDTGRVPTTDTWSIVGDGMRWISQDWLSNVILALGWQLGDTGPSVLSSVWAVLVVGALALLWWAYGLRRPESGWLARLIWLTAGLIVAGPVLGVRVQVVDLLLGAGILVCLWGYLGRPALRWLVPLPFITIAWANLHAGWPLIWLLGGAVVVGESAEHLLRRSSVTPLLNWRQIGVLAAALVISIPFVAVNPNGLALYAYPLEVSSIDAHADFLAEWQPPNPSSIVGQLFIGFTLLVTMPALWVGRHTLRLTDAFLILGLTFMIATGARFLLLAPMIAVTAGLYLEPASAGSEIGQRFATPLARLGTARPGTVPNVVNGVLVALVVIAGMAVTWARVSPAAQSQLIAEHMPVAAVEWIEANDPGSRPFNQYSWGGYLGMHRPEHPIYIDGRSDIYGDAPIREYAMTVALETDPGELLERQGIDYVLFPLDDPLSNWLDRSAEWELVYSDHLAGVWGRSR